MSDLHSVKAPEVPKTKTRTFRVLQRFADASDNWTEAGHINTVYRPDADDVGAQFGEGDYLLIERESDYTFHHVYPMRVVADRVYRLADEDES